MLHSKYFKASEFCSTKFNNLYDYYDTYDSCAFCSRHLSSAIKFNSLYDIMICQNFEKFEEGTS
ncbi:hypothetical protein Hanom_Chr09g00869281 [Helianthus anomalus]